MNFINSAITIVGIPLGFIYMLLMKWCGNNIMDRDGFEGLRDFLSVLWFSGVTTLTFLTLFGLLAWLSHLR